MVVNVTTIHFHYQVVTILGSNVHFNSSNVHYSVFTVYCWLTFDFISLTFMGFFCLSVKDEVCSVNDNGVKQHSVIKYSQCHTLICKFNHLASSLYTALL